jgi:hypothetical protein
MRIFQLARRPPQWLRVALAGLLLAFALNSLAHVTHRHDAATTPASHSVSCGYCVAFGGLAATPTANDASLQLDLAHVAPPRSAASVLAQRPTTSARPRAPPVH